MMKGFWKSGKWMGLLILALAFAGCAGGSGSSSSSEPALASGPGVHGVPITVDPNHQSMTIGDEGGAGYRQLVNGHPVDIQNGSTGCSGAGPTVSCWIKLINRDPSFYMANAFILGTTCTNCVTAVINNADLTHGGAYNGSACGTGQSSLNTDGNAGCGATGADIDGLGMCYVEDGEFKATGAWDNIANCKIHDASLAFFKPNQVLHPQCGSSSYRWDFDGQAALFTFFGQVQTEWFPQNPVSDARMDMQHRATYYVMAVNLNNATSGIGATANARTWLRPGAYRRSQIMSGWGASVSNKVPAGGYFAVNVAIELPDYMESEEVGNTWGNQNYFYYWNYDYILHYNPVVVHTLAGANGKGARTTPGGTTIYGSVAAASIFDDHDCLERGTSHFCTNPGLQSFTGVGTLTGYNGVSWIGLDASNNNAAGTSAFAANVSMSYQTFYGGVANVALSTNFATFSPNKPVAPQMNAHYGRAHLNVPKSGSVSFTSGMTSGAVSHSAIVVQEGVDPDPDIPLGMYYFWVPNGTASDLGSEFYIEMFGSATDLFVGYTNGDIYPGGLPGGDEVTVCIPYQAGYFQGCNTGLPVSTYWVYTGAEYVNNNIGQSGTSVNGGTFGHGAFQQWFANICVQ